MKFIKHLLIIIIIILILYVINSYVQVEGFKGSNVSIPQELVNDWSSDYFAKDSTYDKQTRKFGNTLKLDLVSKKVMIGNSVNELKGQVFNIYSYQQPQTLLAKNANYEAVIKLINENNITFQYTKTGENNWISVSYPQLDYLKNINQGDDVQVDNSDIYETTIPQLMNLNGLKEKLENFKYTKVQPLMTIKKLPLIDIYTDKRTLFVEYCYVFKYPPFLSSDPNFLESTMNNIDSVHQNLGNQNYTLRGRINVQNDLNLNNMTNLEKISLSNIKIVLKTKLNNQYYQYAQKEIPVNGMEKNIDIDYTNLLEDLIAESTSNKNFCYFVKKNKCNHGPLKKRKYVFRGGNENPKPSTEKQCFKTQNQLLKKCGFGSKIRMHYLKIKNGKVLKQTHNRKNNLKSKVHRKRHKGKGSSKKHSINQQSMMLHHQSKKSKKKHKKALKKAKKHSKKHSKKKHHKKK